MIKKFNQTLFLLSLFLLGVAYAQENFVTEYQAVGDVNQINFNNSVEANIKDAVETYLSKEHNIVVKVQSKLRLAKRYRIITEDIQKLSKTPITSNNPNALSTESIPASNQFVDTVILDENEQETITQINADDTTNDQIGDLPLPGSPVYNPDNPRERPTRETRYRNNTERNSANLKKLQNQLSNLQNIIQQQNSFIRQINKNSNVNSLHITNSISTRRELVSDTIEIQNLSIKVWLPDSLNQKQLNFINNLIAEKANLNYVRGDQLNIIKVNFDDITSSEQTPNTFTIDDVWAFISQWIIPFLLLLILIALWFLLNPRKKQPPTYSAYPTESSPYSGLLGASAQNYNVSNDANDMQQRAQIDAVNDEITSTIILGDELLYRCLQNIKNDSNKTHIVAYLQYILGRDVFNKFAQNALSSKDLENHLNISNLDLKEKYSVARETRQELLNASQLVLANNRDKPFDFLNKMSNKQLLYLFSKENTQTQALLLSQMQPQRLAGIISQLPSENQGRVAVEMGKLTDLPLSSYQQMANHLARKANKIPDLQEVNIDGDEVIIRTLEEMDIAGEKTILSSLHDNNPEQFYRIKKSYISFSDLPLIQIDGLKNLLRELEREAIATALYDEEDSFRNTVITALPSRSQILVSQLLKTMTPPTNSEIIENKKDISRHARQLLKANVITLDEKKQLSNPTSTDPAAPQIVSGTSTSTKPTSPKVTEKNALPKFNVKP